MTDSAGMTVGTRVRVIDGQVQHWSEGAAEYRLVEQSLLNAYSGKVGWIVNRDSDPETPVHVEFSENTRVPFRTFRFRDSELGEF